MAVQTLYTAASGVDALQTKLDVIANNLANVNTTSFKKARCNFEDLYYLQERLPGSRDAAGNLTPTGIAVGLGTRVESTQTDFSQGPFQQTNSQLDVAIEGQGFFQVLDPTGTIFYTRAGNFSVNNQGQFVVGSAYTGRLVQPQISIPPDTTGIVISPDGQVSVRQPNQPNLQIVGQLQLANFVNPEGLLKLGENLYAQTEASGPPNIANPGTLGTGLGVLRQSALEASNVEPVTELIDLITTQRAFELNSQVIQAGDQILQLIANLRRF